MYFLAVIFGIINLVFRTGMYAVEDITARVGISPVDKKTVENWRHSQDFNTTSWGDLAGLTLVDMSLGLFMIQVGLPSGIVVGIYAALALLLTWAFQLMATHTLHKPDTGYPSPDITTLYGKIHLIYFFVHALVLVLVTHYIVADLSRLVSDAGYTALFGVGIYLLSFLLDVFENDMFVFKGAMK